MAHPPLLGEGCITLGGWVTRRGRAGIGSRGRGAVPDAVFLEVHQQEVLLFPVEHGDVLDESQFEGVAGVAGGDQAAEQTPELAGILAQGDHGLPVEVFSVETVLAGVLAGTLLALGSARSGGLVRRLELVRQLSPDVRYFHVHKKPSSL